MKGLVSAVGHSHGRMSQTGHLHPLDANSGRNSTGNFHFEGAELIWLLDRLDQVGRLNHFQAYH
jgi:hypothetical protein